MGEVFRSHVQACKGCGQLVAWLQTKAEKWMPVDPDGHNHFPRSGETYDHRKHKSHWETCPKRERFRSRERIVRGVGTEQEEGF